MKQIIQKIFHRIKEDSLAKKKTEIQRVKEYLEWAEIKKCLLLWVADGREPVWNKDVGRELSGKEVEKVCYVPKGVECPLQGTCLCVRDEDLGFGGKIMNAELSEMLNKKYELLIDLTSSRYVITDYIVKASLAGCKVGRLKDQKELDIVLEGTVAEKDFLANLHLLFSNLKKY